MADDSKKFSVAIVGGGICGLLCAIGLNKAGIKVNIFESAAKYGEVGAGVAIGPNAVRVLKAFGVLDEVIQHSDEDGLTMKTFDYIYGTGDCDHIYHYPAREGDDALAVHRASFLDALVRFLDPNLTTAHFLKRCTSVTASPANASRSMLQFSDGTTHETDLVIGADGIRSIVRHAVVGEERATRSLVYTNTVAYRGLVPLETLKSLDIKTQLSPASLEWSGHNRHIVTFPIKKHTVLNIVAFVADNTIPLGSVTLPPGTPWVTPVPQQELLDAYAGWSEDALKMLRCIEKPSKWSIFALDPPLESFVKGRVALVGDAAHAMLPHLGAGVGQGIEDTWVLTQLLAHPETNQSNLEAVLKAYDRLRVPRANFVLRGSIRAGRIYEGFGESGPSAEGIKKDIEGMYEKVWHHDLEGDVREAVARLRAEGAFSGGES